ADESRRGPEPPGAHTGAAGGSLCGDLVRISLETDAGVVRAATFDAEGCAALRACAAAACEELEGAAVLDAARLSADRIAELVGGVSPQGRHAVELVGDAVGRALAALASSGETIADPPAGDRVLVAMSGGVDSAVAAVLERERGADVVGVTLKLWADERTDGTQACCSPEAVRGARALAHSLGIPHLTLDLEASFRNAVVGAFVDGYRAGETPNPCVICNGDLRIDAMVALADRVGAGALATGHYARVVDDGDGPPPAAAAAERKDPTHPPSGPRPGAPARPGAAPGRSRPVTPRASPPPAPARCSPPPPTSARTRPTCSPACARRRWRACASRSRSCVRTRCARSPPATSCRSRASAR